MSEAQSEAQDVEAVLSKLQASPKTRSAKWARVKASLGPIYEARDRGISWNAIAEALCEVGLDVHPESLRLFARKHQRDHKVYPRTIAGPPKRRPSKTRTETSKSNATLEPVAADNAQLESELKAQLPATPPPTTEPAPAPKSGSTSNPSEFAGIRRLNARK